MINPNTLIDGFIKIMHNIGEKQLADYPQIQMLLTEVQSTINRLESKYQELLSQQQQQSQTKKQKFTILSIENQSSIISPQQNPQLKHSSLISGQQQLPQQQQYQTSNLKVQSDHAQQKQQLMQLTQGQIIDKKLFLLKYKKDQDNCPIDLEHLFDDDPNREVIELPCTHCFHIDCLLQCVKNNSLSCPIDKAIYGTIIGDQPEGRMNWQIEPVQCYGYNCNTIAILYQFPNGVRNGVRYTGTVRKAYLPNNQEGQEALKLLKRAFDQKLTFRVGDSDTTGQKNTVVWNVHHKTSLSGGPTFYGYPDPTYFQRLKDELAQKGIK